MLYCPRCHSIYTDDFRPHLKYDDIEGFEPIPKCVISGCNGNLLDVDELMIPLIDILESKGIHTIFSCSGHVKNSFIDTYILMEGDQRNYIEDYPFNNKNVSYDFDGNYTKYCKISITSNGIYEVPCCTSIHITESVDGTFIDRQQIIFDHMRILYDWAKSI